MNKSKQPPRSTWRMPPLAALASIVLAFVATAIWWDAVVVDANRSDIANLSLAIGSAMKLGVAFVVWCIASLLGLLCCLLAIWFHRFRLWGAVALGACLVPVGLTIAEQISPSSEKLVFACKKNDLPAIEYWLGRGVDINGIATMRLGFAQGKSQGSTPLTAAAEFGRVEALQLLLNRGADPNRADGFGIRPLHRAIESRSEQSVRLLLQNGAALVHPAQQPSLMGRPQWDALSWTVWCDRFGTHSQSYVTIAEAIVTSGGDVVREDLLFDAMWHSPTTALGKRLAELAETQIDLQGQAAKNDTNEDPFFELLCNLARGDDVLAAKLVSEHPALLERRRLKHHDSDVGRRHLFILAAKFGDKEVVELLLERGQPIGEKKPLANYAQKDALQQAAANGHVDVVKLLLDRGAFISRQGAYQGSALSYAAGRGHFEVTKLLLDRGADPDGPKGNSEPLFDAARSGRLATVRLLVERGAKTETVVQHRRPIDWARDYGHQDIVQFLSENKTE